MRATVGRDRLLAMAERAIIVAGKTTLSEFTVKGDRVTLDTETTFRLTQETAASDGEDGCVRVRPVRLRALLQCFDTDLVTLNAEPPQFTFTAGETSATIACEIPFEDKNPRGPVQARSGSRVDGAVINQALRKVLRIRKTAEKCYVRCEGALIGKVVAATDGHRLVVTPVEWDGPPPGRVLPWELVRAWEHATREGGTWTFAPPAAGKYGVIAGPGFIVSSWSMPDKFPEWESAIQAELHGRVTVRLSDLRPVLHRASIVGESARGSKSVHIGIRKDDRMSVVARDAIRSERFAGVIPTEAVTSPKRVSVGLDARLLLGMLPLKGEVTITFGGEVDPVNVRQGGDLYVLMPMRLDYED